MKLENMTIVEHRLHEKSTQIYFERVNFHDGDVFFVPVGDYTKPIGYLKFKRIAKEAKEGCFELSELVSLDYPNPNPKLSLSGVLYSRKAALEAHRVVSAYQQTLNRWLES